MIVYIREQHTVVRKRGGRLLVEKNGEALGEIRVREMTGLCVFGSVQITTQALSELLDAGIEVGLYTRNGRLKGRVAPEAAGRGRVEIEQWAMQRDEAKVLEMARAIVRAKVESALSLIGDHLGNHPQERAGVSAALERMKAARTGAASAGGVDEVRGYEGSAAAAYWEVFAVMNRSVFPFPGRRKRPATDPLNAMLSLGYTMLTREIASALEARGFRVVFGFLHSPEYGRPSLALDLVELFRAPVVDRMVLTLANLGMVGEEDFARRIDASRAGGVILAPGSLPAFLKAYEVSMTGESRGAPLGLRKVMEEEVEKLARAVREGSDYEPWVDRRE